MRHIPRKKNCIRQLRDSGETKDDVSILVENYPKNETQVSVHGVALEAMGRGILITGESGIGKTTASIEVMKPGFFWIADDLAVIKKNFAGILNMTGHPKIRKYLHTNHTGIIEVSQLIPKNQIKKKTKLQAIIEVVKSDTEVMYHEWQEKPILETLLPCQIIFVPRTGYFHKNLLQNAILHFQEAFK